MSTALATRRNPQTDAPSPGQMAFLKDLLAQIGEIQPGKRDELRMQMNSEYLRHTLTVERASRRIDQLKAIRNDLRARQRSMEDQLRKQEQGEIPAPRTADRPQVPAGRYAVENDEGKLAFYRVAVDKGGRYSVFVYASTAQHRIKGWAAMLSILLKIEAAGTESAGIRFGKEMKVCGKCGIALTDEESRALGIGPICGGRR